MPGKGLTEARSKINHIELSDRPERKIGSDVPRSARRSRPSKVQAAIIDAIKEVAVNVRIFAFRPYMA